MADDRQRIRQTLIAAGFSPAEVDQWLEVRPAQGQSLEEAWREAGVPEEAITILKYGSGRVQLTPEGGAIDPRAAAAKQAAGEELSAEELAAVQANPDIAVSAGLEQLGAHGLAQQVLSGILREEYDYDWVYQIIIPGALDTDDALVQLIPYLEEIVGVDILSPEEGGDRSEADQVRQILATARDNEFVQLAVIEWARDNTVYVPDRFEQGVLDLVKQGVSLSRAVTVVNTARRFDLNPVDLYRVWIGQRDKETKYFQGSVAGLERAMQRGEGVQDYFRASRPLLNVAVSFRQGLDLYDGSFVLAAVHVNDPVLASRLRTDPYGLDAGELQRALDYIGGSEGQEDNPQVQWILNRLAGGYNKVVEVDAGSIQDAVATIANAWNLTGSDPIAAQLAGEIIADAVARARATLPNPFAPIGDPISVADTIQDIQAHVKARLRQLPEYRELFGHLAPGESEEEYVSRFEQESQEILGDNVADVVRVGMRAGDRNAIYQQALLAGAGESSTRFQEILARNAEVFRRTL